MSSSSTHRRRAPYARHVASVLVLGAMACKPAASPSPSGEIVETRTSASPEADERAPRRPSDGRARADARPLATPPPAPPPADPIPDDNLPPARPTTLPLRAGDAADADIDAADAAFEQGNMVDAAKALARARAKAPQSPGVIATAARLDVAKASLPTSFGAGKDNAAVVRALSQLHALVAKHPEYAAASGELGRLLLVAGDGPGARDALRSALSALTTQAEIHGNLGLALLVAGERDAAIAELKRACELDAGSAPRRGNLATALLLDGRVDEAVRHYGVQVKLSPADAHGHSDLGTALLGTSDLTRALKELERAVELDGARATYRSNYGYALSRAKRPTDAIVQFRKAVALDPKLVSGWMNLGIELARNPSTRDEGKKALEKAHALDPNDERVKEVLDELKTIAKPTK